MKNQTRNLINGEWIGARSGAELNVTDPATDEIVASVPNGDAHDARLAIEAASCALPEWRKRPARDRAEILRRLAGAMLRDQERLALIMTREQGKPIAQSRAEIAYAASFIEWSAEEAKRVYGETIPASTPDKRILVLRQPIGVTAAITPWNFPSAMITRKLGPALAAGCTMTVKPAEQTPLSAIALGELALEAGVPPGVFNIVTGDAESIGGEFLTNPIVRKLSFTGSTEVGKILMRGASQNVTRLSLELGGHAPFIVFDDADLDAAVSAAITSKFRNSGQTCICPNRFYIHQSIHAVFMERLPPEVEKLRVAIGTDENAQIGPLIDDAAVDKVRAHINDAKNKGARIAAGGALLDPFPGAARRFFAPTILDNVTPDMLCSTEETFGPVIPIRTFSDEQQVIDWANDSSYGLAAYIFTRDAARTFRVAEALEYGVIGVNDGAPSTAQAPFGGFKQSGIGREGGRYAMHEYLEVKYVSWKVE